MQRAGLEDVKLQSVAGGDTAVWWINAALLPDGVCAEEVGMGLMGSYPDIEIRPGFFPLDQMTIFKYPEVTYCPNTDLLYKRLVCLPSSAQLKEANIERICMALAESLTAVMAKDKAAK